MAFTFQDIFKSSFLETVSTITPLDMALTIFLSFVLGLFIFWVYKRTYAGVMYSAGFGITLIALTMITSVLILAVTSNIVLSLGMVGALSIVRFRTAIKDPVDIAFLFWAISAGIILAAGFLPLAMFASLAIGLMLTLFSTKKNVDRPYILVLHCENTQVEEQAHRFIEDKVKKLSLKSKSVDCGCIELNYEVRLKEADTGFLNALAAIKGVSHTVMVSYNGDYMG